MSRSCAETDPRYKESVKIGLTAQVPRAERRAAAASTPRGTPPATSRENSIGVRRKTRSFWPTARGIRSWWSRRWPSGLCREAGLVSAGVIAIDGRKPAASASWDRNKRYRRIVHEILEEAERADREEDEAYGHYRATERDTRGRRLSCSPKPYEPPAEPEGKINTTDPDSRLMKTLGIPPSRGGNAQAAVNEHQVMVAAEVCCHTTSSAPQPPSRHQHSLRRTPMPADPEHRRRPSQPDAANDAARPVTRRPPSLYPTPRAQAEVSARPPPRPPVRRGCSSRRRPRRDARNGRTTIARTSVSRCRSARAIPAAAALRIGAGDSASASKSGSINTADRAAGCRPGRSAASTWRAPPGCWIARRSSSPRRRAAPRRCSLSVGAVRRRSAMASCLDRLAARQEQVTAGRYRGKALGVGVWPVFLPIEMYQDHGNQFAVGGVIAWEVLLVDGEQQDWPTDRLMDSTVRIIPRPAWAVRGSLADTGAMRVCWVAPSPWAP